MLEWRKEAKGRWIVSPTPLHASQSFQAIPAGLTAVAQRGARTPEAPWVRARLVCFSCPRQGPLLLAGVESQMLFIDQTLSVDEFTQALSSAFRTAGQRLTLRLPAPGGRFGVIPSATALQKIHRVCAGEV